VGQSGLPGMRGEAPPTPQLPGSPGEEATLERSARLAVDHTDGAAKEEAR
jgi:hypothetical protein